MKLPLFLSTLALVHAAAANEEKPAEALENVVVTAQRIIEELKAEQSLTPGGVTVLDGDELYERSVSNRR